MTRRVDRFILLLVVTLIAASCGGDDSAETTADANDPTAQADDSSGSNGGSPSSDNDSADGSGIGSSEDGGSDGDPVINPNDMPGTGEIVFQVDGQTYTVSADDVDFFTCEIGDDFVNVRAESTSENWTVQVDPGAGRANASLQLEDARIGYNSFTASDVVGGFVVEAPFILYEARFDASDLDDLSFEDVGTGRMSVTCP